MRRNVLFFVLALLGMTQAAAQDYEYVPFVREGVKWVYRYYNPFGRGVLDMDEGIQYYSFEMKGDVEIGGKHYKQVSLTHYLGDDGKEVEDFVPICLREEDKVVYAIHPDGILYPQCPVGIGGFVGYNGCFPVNNPTEEFILYDFNDPIAFYDSIFWAQNMDSEIYGFEPYVEYKGKGMESYKNYHYKCYHYKCREHYGDQKILEGIGCDGSSGMPLFYFQKVITGFAVDYRLSHVIENGEMIYKGMYYEPGTHVGIDEVVAGGACRTTDGNYYNLLGQPVGTGVPTAPGLYIHQGRKIIVR